MRADESKPSPLQHRGTALVTGAGRGIGRAIAHALAADGFDVVMASLEAADPDPAHTAAAGAHGPGRVIYQSFDVAELEAHATLVTDAIARFGPLTCLVNNAGVTSLERGDMLDLSAESFDRCVAVNLRGTFFLTQAVARHLLADASAGNRYRSIITVSSVNADIVGENRADYCLTKSALTMLNKLFAMRLAAAGVGVFEIRPGIVATDMTAPAKAKYDGFIDDGGVPMRRWGMPEDIGRGVATLARGDLPYATGIHIDIGGGMQLHRV
jgi:3-oxoacyl-[acyl-carrier protein] reductase